MGLRKTKEKIPKCMLRRGDTFFVHMCFSAPAAGFLLRGRRETQREREREREGEVRSERKRGEGGERVWKRQWGWSSENQKHLAASLDFTGLRQQKLDMYLRVCVLVHVQPHMHAPR